MWQSSLSRPELTCHALPTSLGCRTRHGSIAQLRCAGWPELFSQLLATGMLATSCSMLAPQLHYVGDFLTCRLLNWSVAAGGE